MADKHAIVAQLRRLGGGGKPLGPHVQKVAEQQGVSPTSVYQWLADDRFNEATPPSPSTRKRFEVTIEHLTVIANEQNLRLAYDKIRSAGLLECSYRTFARAVKERTDPTLVAAALDGHKGLVNNRLYLKWVPPHRCHTYHLDHTKLDLWVWPSHRHRAPIRPHVTVIVDGYSGLLHAVPWNADVNGDMVAAALADAAVEREYHGHHVGGQPEQVILDNAAAHFGPSMRAGVEQLGWIITPTAAYSSWQNGKAERAVGLLNSRVADRAPGATNSGTTRTGAPRNVERLPENVLPEHVWTWNAFAQALREEVDAINTTLPVQRLGGMTRLQAYAQDQTERRPLSAEEARLAMMTSGTMTYTATKNGLSFQGVDYVGSCLEFGAKYLIRFLPTQRDFIEVFDTSDEYVGTAYAALRLPKDERDRHMAKRARQEREARAIEFGVQAFRRHQAEIDNAGVDYERQSGGELAEGNEPAAVSRIDRARGDTAKAKPKRPRVPAPTRSSEPTISAFARERLHDIYGQEFTPSSTKEEHP